MATDRIAPGKFVAIAYDLYTTSLEDGDQLVHSLTDKDPESFIFGVTPGLLPGLVHELEGLSEGDRFDVRIPSEQGFAYNPDDVVTIPIDIFLDDKGKLDTNRIKVGHPLPMITADGYQITGMVKQINDDNIVMDFNHPLVGKNLHFVGKVLTVRDATPEELRPSFGGCGGCGGGCCGGQAGDGGDDAQGCGGCCGGCN